MGFLPFVSPSQNVIQGSVFSAIGGGIIALVGAIAALLTVIVSGITIVRLCRSIAQLSFTSSCERLLYLFSIAAVKSCVAGSAHVRSLVVLNGQYTERFQIRTDSRGVSLQRLKEY